MLMSAGLFFESGIASTGNYWIHVAPGMVLMALGMGATFVSVTIAATSGVPRSEAGLASGLVTTSQQIGGAVGLAAITAVAASSATRYIKSVHLLAPPSHELVAIATIHGFQEGFLVGGFFALGAAVIAFIFVRPVVPAPAPAQPTPVSTGPQPIEAMPTSS
jgi:hypothetical protein